MFTRVRISKSMPGSSIDYITAKNIMPEAQKRNLHSNTLSPEMEMRRTAERFGKWKRHEERKTLSLIISPNPADNPTEEQVQDVTNAVLDRFFSTIQGVVVLHRDKKGTADADKSRPVLHAHFVGSIVDPVTGKNIHFAQGDLKVIQRWADQYAHEKYGWQPFTPTRERKAHNRYRNAALRALSTRGSYSWKLDMASRIERRYSEAASYQDFVNMLASDGIEVITSRKDRNSGEIKQLPELRFSIRHRNRLMVVKASTISKMLTPPEMQKRFPELGGSNGQIRGFSGQGQRQIYAPKSVGKGHAGRQPAGENSGQGQNGVTGGKADFNCIICSHDKELCEQCSRFERWQGGISHGRYERTR